VTGDGAVRRLPRQGRSAARVADILAAARRLLQTDDLGELTVRAIAADAGIGTASVYRYFADVDEIVDVLLTEHADASAEAVRAALAATTSRTVGGVFEAVLRAFLHLYDTRPDLTVMWRSPVLADRQRRHDETADRTIADTIGRHLVDTGAITDTSPEMNDRLAVHFQVAGTLLGAVLRADPTTRPVLEADLFALVRHLSSRY
jgi:AcrR family transcriptional regulator